jgi:L-cysteine S-thiosulfotransferase
LAGAFFRLKNSHSEVRSGDRLWARCSAALAPIVALCGLVAAAPSPPAHAEDRAAGAMANFQVAGDGIAQPLAGTQGDAERGRALLVERGAANCLL